MRLRRQRSFWDVGLSPNASVRVADLAHGERKQLELAVALATRPSLLLLDEPMAGLSPAESQEMVALLLKLKGRVTIVLVEHDMDAVVRAGRPHHGAGVRAGGGHRSSDEIRVNPAVRAAYLGEDGGLLRPEQGDDLAVRHLKTDVNSTGRTVGCLAHCRASASVASSPR